MPIYDAETVTILPYDFKIETGERIHSQHKMSYRTWKTKIAPSPDAPLNLHNVSEFPSLSTVKPSTIQGVSLAEKLKKTIQAEEEQYSLSRFQKKAVKPNDLYVLPMPTFLGKLQREKREKEEKKRIEEEEEENYRWQISHAMYHPDQGAEPYEPTSSQTPEDDHCSNQESIVEHDRM